MIYIPIIGALAYGLSSFLEKITLKNKKIFPSHFVVALFFSAVVVMLPFIYFFGKIESEAFSGINLIILAGIVLFSIIANILAFYSLKWEKLTTLEPIRLLEPLFVVLLAFAFFPSERNVYVFIPAIIAGLALIFSHIKRHHLEFNKFLIAALFSSLFYSIELILTKIILPYYNPLTLYFIRSLFIFLFALMIFHPNLVKELNKKEKITTFLIGALWVAFRVATYYGYLSLGVISTTLILMVAPIFIYFLAWKFLKEEISIRNLISAIIILTCVAYVLLN